ncbi:hypothetical protein L6452_37677 [Arctium lappa]|uniref:Uncharacterized protein n=1 Tax=Arctium lappa TaxID=4217 RepID=A0ACB8Y4C6_ARCLA|nr:hypothetical protein L6452_37677 [Arctium lappa]
MLYLFCLWLYIHNQSSLGLSRYRAMNMGISTKLPQIFVEGTRSRGDSGLCVESLLPRGNSELWIRHRRRYRVGDAVTVDTEWETGRLGQGRRRPRGNSGRLGILVKVVQYGNRRLRF